MPTSFIDENGNYYETTSNVPPRPGHLVVPKRPDQHAVLVGNAWQAGTPPPQMKRSLARWAFMQTLDEAGHTAAIDALIVALPAGAQKSRALGKWRHDTEFDAYDADMVALSGLATASIVGFDFDALWASAEALQYG